MDSSSSGQGPVVGSAMHGIEHSGNSGTFLTTWQTTSILRWTQICGVCALNYGLNDSRLVWQYCCLYAAERRWGWQFPHPSRPVTGAHPASCLLAGGKAAGSWWWPPTPLLYRRGERKSRPLPLLPLWVFWTVTGWTYPVVVWPLLHNIIRSSKYTRDWTDR
jgi:hypothetical protein